MKTILIIVAFLFLHPLSIASNQFKEDFNTDAFVKSWAPFTNDDNLFHGWVWEEGYLFNKMGNEDNTPGGERYLIKPGVLNLKEIKYPLEICYDVFPYDYVGKNELFFGVSIFSKPRIPDKSGIIVALRRDYSEFISGLNLRISGKGWVSPENNITTTSLFFQWRRIRIRIEKDIKNSRYKILARSWLEGKDEPSQWLLEQDLHEKSIPEMGDGVGFVAYSLEGQNKFNPRAYYDNLAITQNGISANIFPMKKKEEGDKLREKKIKELTELFEEEQYPVFAYNFERFYHSLPEFPIPPEMYFDQIVSLRWIHEWKKARDLANSIPKIFPGTKYADMIGGAHGRTEDDAAVRYAYALKPYPKHEFSECVKMLREFLKDFHNNWRRKEALLYICKSLYWMKEYDDLFKQAEILHNEFGKGKESEEVMIMQICARIHRKEQEEARELVYEFRARFPNSKNKDEVDHLELESYLYKENMDITLEKYNNPENKYFLLELESDLRYLMDKWIKKEQVSWFGKDMDFLFTLYEKTGRQKDAEDLIYEMISITSSSPKILREAYRKGASYFRRKERMDIVEELTRMMVGIEEDPKKKKELNRLLGIALRKQGKMQEAEMLKINNKDK